MISQDIAALEAEARQLSVKLGALRDRVSADPKTPERRKLLFRLDQARYGCRNAADELVLAQAVIVSAEAGP